MNIDHQLREALRRKEAPADLADRVLARLDSARQPAPRSGSVGIVRWLAAAAVIALSVGAAERYYTEQRQQAAEAVRVHAELRMALEITNHTLAVVQNKLSQSARNEDR